MFTLDRVETPYRLETSMKSWEEYNDSSFAILVLPCEAPYDSAAKNKVFTADMNFTGNTYEGGMP